LPRPVWLLGWASFFTDAASEMIYPLLPLFLTRTLGAGALSLGVIEGVADAATSVLKIASGWLSDRSGVKRPLVIGGYALSSAVRPLIALASAWPQVLAIRFTDRLGKGIRGAPRDAMLAQFAEPGTRGRVFGFHRAMDHAGAMIGPLLASACLFGFPGEYRTVFALAVVPGAIAVLVLFLVPKDDRPGPGAPPSRGEDAPLSRRFYLTTGVLFVFMLGNSTDAFLLLRLGDAGVAAFLIPLLWSALHVVKASTSTIGGALSDRFGRRAIIAVGWAVFAAVYAGFAVADTAGTLVPLFLVYGLFFGLTEGPEKALVADLARQGLRGTAFGVYNAAIGVGALGASVLFGFVWSAVGAAVAFAMGAAIAIVAIALLFAVVPAEENA
jgi:MFS family permease